MNTIKTLFLFVVAAFVFAACKSKTERPKTALDTGRTFIRATLDGNLDLAETFVAPDSLNRNVFSSYKEFYKTLKAEQKTAYKNAAYTLNSFRELNDSVTMINYSNDYMKKPMEIRLIKQNGQWNVDFSFTSGDSVPAQ